jgi:Methyltransferase domain
MEFKVFPNGGIQPRRYRPGGVGNWSGHLPFAYDLVATAKPSLLVELGTHYGESYFGFCQAVAEKLVPCSCYAVDTWAGEPHSGFYDESVYDDVSAHNSTYYSSFSYLLRSTFDSALLNFADESIDILHIDGLHTYEAVSHDLRSWMPKVKPGGIVLLHDIMARHADFGVWNVWQELTAAGEHFAFSHSWGLGVFRKPGGVETANAFLTALFHSPGDAQEHVRKYYALCAAKLEHEYESLNRHRGPAEKVLIQIYPFGENGYSADRCIGAYAQPNQWDHLSVELMPGIGHGALRIDPTDQTGVVDIAGIALRRLVDGETIWSAKGYSEIAALSIGGTLVRLDNLDNHEFCRFISNGLDPQLFLPELDWKRLDQPVSVDIWLRIQSDVTCLLPMLQVSDQQRSEVRVSEGLLTTSEAALTEAQASVERLTESQAASEAERHILAQQCQELIRERDSLLVTFRKLESDLYVSRSDLKHEREIGRRAEEERHRTEEEKSSSKLSDCQNNLVALQQRLNLSEMTLHEALTSRSWRITAPMRDLIAQLKRLVRS